MTHPKLYELSIQSKRIMFQNKQESVFKSNTLNKLFTDEFQYKGSKPNTIYDLDSKNKPTELRVEYQYSKIDDNYYKEDWFLYDKDDVL